jgi:hypothetical protein
MKGLAIFSKGEQVWIFDRQMIYICRPINLLSLARKCIELLTTLAYDVVEQ